MKNFQTIKTVLSDEKAEELYLQTESLLKNMQDILQYLKGDLLTYFNSVIASLKQDMSKVETSIADLQSKGINLQDEVKKIRKADKLARKKKLQKTEDESKKQDAEQKSAQAKKTVEAKKGWFDSIALIWQYPLNLLNNAWSYVVGFFVTKKVEVVARKPEVQVKEDDAKSEAVVKEKEKK